jgi:probable HAF family extracellular repeat protein
VYHEVVVPGAVFANAQGINANGDIVGIYRDAAGRTHGYLWKRGEVTIIDYPGAAMTEARGISPEGDIVGTYRMPGEAAVNFHGYLLGNDGVFSNVDYPGHTSTIAQRILPDGTILGCRHDTDLMMTMRGVLMNQHGNQEIDEFASMHNGATPDGELIVGLFTDMMTGRGEGYVIENGEFTPFVVPGSTFTAAWDVNPRGEIVGVFRDPANRFHGFVRNGDHYVAVDVPGATATRAFGINAGGDVVGAFVDAAGVTRAFVATRTNRRKSVS